MDKSSLDPMLKTFLLSFIWITLKILIILTAVWTLWVKTTSFIALFTAAWVAIWMSLSGTLQNFAGGMIILAFRLYKIWDYISIWGFEWTVKSIHIFHTIVLTLDRKTIIFPNSKISNWTMINFSTEKIRRMDLNLNIWYNEDLEFVKKVIKEVFLKDERILIDEDKDFDLNIFVNEIKWSGIMLTVRYFVESKLLLKVKSEIYEKVLVACKENNIDLSYGQFDIKMIK